MRVGVEIIFYSLLSGAVNKLHDIEERIRRTEDSSKENKSALGKETRQEAKAVQRLKL